MQILIRSNDIIYLTWVKSILSHNNIEFIVLDESMASTEGNISAIPVRILVDDNSPIEFDQPLFEVDPS